MKSVLHFGLGLALVASSLSGASAVAFQPRGNPLLPELTDSAELSTPVIAEGVVRNSDGGLYSEANVQLMAWPDDLSKLTVGDAVKLQPIAKAVTTAGGKYQLRVKNVESISAVSQPGKVINLEVVASGKEGVKSVAFSRKLIDAAPKSLVSKISTTLNSTPANQVNIRIGAKTASDRASSTNSKAAIIGGPVSDKDCVSFLVQDYGITPIAVGMTMNLSNGMKSNESYKAGVTTSIGVGFSATGNAGSWSQSGTSTSTSSSTITFPTNGQFNTRFNFTNFKFGKFSVQCVNVGSSASWYEVRATDLAGGTIVQDFQEFPTTYTTVNTCVDQLPGTAFQKLEDEQTTFNNAANLSLLGIGFNLTSQTGWTRESEVVYNFTQLRKMCGADDYPGSHNPRYVFAAKANQIRPK